MAQPIKRLLQFVQPPAAAQRALIAGLETGVMQADDFGAGVVGGFLAPMSGLVRLLIRGRRG
jgi:hypothetical protein